ncbi:MAG TPA: hypothetical protein VF677_13550 [Flavobacterium sp.]|jgi:hypothetical protein
MKLQTTLIYFFVLFILCSSCKKELEPQESSVIPDAIKGTNNPATASAAAQNQAATTQNIQAVNGTNPPHGQPGHRCDIAAGAPLSGTTVTQPARQQNPDPAMQQMKVNVPAATAQNTVTPKGMNPPHGQPGHRCDVSVGSPLNSAAAKPAVPQTTTTTQEIVVPTPPAGQNANVVTAPGMNPPHGQEGHQCGIAVGAPLPKP